jgi:hypothetical protein
MQLNHFHCFLTVPCLQNVNIICPPAGFYEAKRAYLVIFSYEDGYSGAGMGS